MNATLHGDGLFALFQLYVPIVSSPSDCPHVRFLMAICVLVLPPSF